MRVSSNPGMDMMLHSNAGERYRLVLLKNGGSVREEARTQIYNVG